MERGSILIRSLASAMLSGFVLSFYDFLYRIKVLGRNRLSFCMKQIFKGLKCFEKKNKLRRVFEQGGERSLSLQGKGARLLVARRRVLRILSKHFSPSLTKLADDFVRFVNRLNFFIKVSLLQVVHDVIV